LQPRRELRKLQVPLLPPPYPTLQELFPYNSPGTGPFVIELQKAVCPQPPLTPFSSGLIPPPFPAPLRRGTRPDLLLSPSHAKRISFPSDHSLTLFSDDSTSLLSLLGRPRQHCSSSLRFFLILFFNQTSSEPPFFFPVPSSSPDVLPEVDQPRMSVTAAHGARDLLCSSPHFIFSF